MISLDNLTKEQKEQMKDEWMFEMMVRHLEKRNKATEYMKRYLNENENQATKQRERSKRRNQLCKKVSECDVEPVEPVNDIKVVELNETERRYLKLDNNEPVNVIVDNDGVMELVNKPDNTEFEMTSKPINECVDKPVEPDELVKECNEKQKRKYSKRGIGKRLKETNNFDDLLKPEKETNEIIISETIIEFNENDKLKEIVYEPVIEEIDELSFNFLKKSGARVFKNYTNNKFYQIVK